MNYLSIMSNKIRRTKSHICQLESETIAEELDDFDNFAIGKNRMTNDNFHVFKVPARMRADSDGLLHPHINSDNPLNAQKNTIPDTSLH